MTLPAFDQAFEIVVGHEGGYVNDPNDPGGETKFGISKRSYPEVNIGALTLDVAKQLYRRDYWNRIEGDSLDPGLALVCFDAAVNCGVSRAVRWLQEAVGARADGVIGPETRAKTQAANADEALVSLHAARIHYMASLPGWVSFGKGWSKRLAELPMQAAGMTA